MVAVYTTRQRVSRSGFQGSAMGDPWREKKSAQFSNGWKKDRWKFQRLENHDRDVVKIRPVARFDFNRSILRELFFFNASAKIKVLRITAFAESIHFTKKSGA